ncbi:MAG: M48 family metalloprotease, partial [Rhizobacter sp.]|nr:M48 family metalloprotease [Rhizobacter sp.]
NKASQSAAAGYVASYSRDQESQADKLAAEYLARNRYDPKNMVDVTHSEEPGAVRDRNRQGRRQAGDFEVELAVDAPGQRQAPRRHPRLCGALPGTDRLRRRWPRPLPEGDRRDGVRR